MSERPYDNLMKLVDKNYYTLTALERLVRDSASNNGAYLSFRDAAEAAAELAALRSRVAELEAVRTAAKNVANYPIMLGDEYPGFIDVLDKLDEALRGAK